MQLVVKQVQRSTVWNLKTDSFRRRKLSAAPRCLKTKRSNLQLLDEGGIRVRGVVDAAVPAHGRARVKEVDSEVGIIAFDGLRDVLDDGDVEGNRDAEDRQNDRLVLLV